MSVVVILTSFAVSVEMAAILTGYYKAITISLGFEEQTHNSTCREVHAERLQVVVQHHKTAGR